MKSRISFRIEVNKPDESLLADYAKLRLLVGAHTTILTTSPDAFLLIAATLEESGLSFLDQMLPLDGRRRLGGQVAWVVRLGSQGSVSGKYIGSSLP